MTSSLTSLRKRTRCACRNGLECKSDGGKRKFICVQWAQETPTKSEARKAGYETIFDITRARIDKAEKKIIESENPDVDLDIGFRF